MAATNTGVAQVAAACLLLAGCAAPLNHTIDPAGRSVPGGRDVQIVVEQREIETRIIESNMTAAAGGGALFALLDMAVNQAKVNSAEQSVVPLRDALVGYDFDGKVQAALNETVARHPWLGVRNVSLVKETNAGLATAALDATTADQLAFVTYDYAVAADFKSLEVSLGVALANKAVPEGQAPEARLKPANLPYTRAFKSVIPLDAPAKEDTENVQRWSADGGRLARSALDTGVQRVHWMLERSLQQTPEAAAAIGKAPKAKAGTYAGKLVEKSPYGDLVEVLVPTNLWVLAEAPVK